MLTNYIQVNDMRKYFISIFLILWLALGYTTEFNDHYSDFELSYTFSNTYLIIKDFNRDTYEKTEKKYKYEIKKEHGIEYICVDNKKYLMLKCKDLLFLFDNQNKLFFKGTIFGIMHDEFVDIFDSCKTSSFLQKDGIDYSWSELKGRGIGKPWIEGEKGYGIAEWMQFGVSKKENIYLSIGFVDYNNPQLYREYSRPKKLKIFLNDKFLKYVELEDTPDFQKIEIRGNEPGRLRLEIWDIYEGTKYSKDTCVNMAVYDSIASE